MDKQHGHAACTYILKVLAKFSGSVRQSAWRVSRLGISGLVNVKFSLLSVGELTNKQR
jgi:hypothetical protein